MIEALFPCHALAVFCVVAFAVYRGKAFPLKLAAIYAAFFYSSWYLELNILNAEAHIIFGFLFATIMYRFAHESPRGLYVDMFCLAMIFARINYILIFIGYTALSGEAYLAVEHLYTVMSIVLSIVDIALLVGVINGSRSDTVYTGLGDYIRNGMLGALGRMEAVQTYDWPQRAPFNQRRPTGQR
jgi:uncharacterized membrane protein